MSEPESVPGLRAELDKLEASVRRDERLKIAANVRLCPCQWPHDCTTAHLRNLIADQIERGA